MPACLPACLSACIVIHPPPSPLPAPPMLPAAAYQNSHIAAANGAMLLKYASHDHELSQQQKKELATRRDTMTPFW